MPEDTSTRVRRAIGGDADSLAWMIDRVTPILLMQARHRLGPNLRDHYDLEDLVQEVWAIALPKLSTLADRDEFDTEQLLAFLGRILLFRVSNMVQKHITGKPRRDRAGSDQSSPLQRLPDEQSGVITRAVKAERSTALHQAMDSLNERDRALIVSRGLERHPVKEIATVLGISENNVSVAYKRALDKLRALLPGSILEELPDG